MQIKIFFIKISVILVSWLWFFFLYIWLFGFLWQGIFVNTYVLALFAWAWFNKSFGFQLFRLVSFLTGLNSPSHVNAFGEENVYFLSQMKPHLYCGFCPTPPPKFSLFLSFSSVPLFSAHISLSFSVLWTCLISIRLAEGCADGSVTFVKRWKACKHVKKEWSG